VLDSIFLTKKISQFLFLGVEDISILLFITNHDRKEMYDLTKFCKDCMKGSEDKVWKPIVDADSSSN